MTYKPIFYYDLTFGMSIIGIEYSGIDWKVTTPATTYMIFGLVGFGMWIEHYMKTSVVVSINDTK